MSDKKQKPETEDKVEKGAIESSNIVNSGKKDENGKEISKSGDALAEKTGKSDKTKEPTHGKTTKKRKHGAYPWFAIIALILVLGLGAGNSFTVS